MIFSLLKILFSVLFSAAVSSVIILVSPLDRTGRLFHALARFHARGILKACGVKLSVTGLEKVDFSRSHIYVSNHASFFDIPAVIAGIPDQIRIVYKKELEKIPIFGWGLKFGKTYISIDREKGQNAIQSLDMAAEKIRRGASVILFAEGTRTPDGRLQPFKRGAFNLALRAGIPVVPLTIKGSYGILPRHSMRIKPGTISLVLDEPIEPPNSNGKDVELMLRDKVHKIIQQHTQEP